MAFGWRFLNTSDIQGRVVHGDTWRQRAHSQVCSELILFTYGAFWVSKNDELHFYGLN